MKPSTQPHRSVLMDRLGLRGRRAAAVASAAALTAGALAAAGWSTPASASGARGSASDAAASSNQAVSSYPAAVEADSPSLYWRFDEASGPTAADSSGNGNTATYRGGYTLGQPGALQGSSDTAVALNGSTGYVTGDTRVTNPQTFTAEAWFKTTSTTGGEIIGFGSAPAGASASKDRLVYLTDSGQVDFGVYADNQTETVTSPAAYNDGSWHLVDATLGSDGMRLYVDGHEVAADPTTTSAAAYNGYWRLGWDTLSGWPDRPSTDQLAGTLDEAAVYPTALSTSQVVTHWEAAGYPAPQPTSADMTVSSTPGQTIAGFGAFGDWWTNDLQYFPRAAQQQVGRLLFTQSGIALSQYRYNIGGGGAGVTVPSGDESQYGAATRAPQTFYVGPGNYDWSRNPGGTTFLKMAAADHVPVVAHVNSAPPQFTSNNQSCGGTLVASQIPAYAQYVADVVAHLANAWGANVTDVSPMNEPDYTRSDCTQEGMAVPPSERAQVVHDVRADLTADGVPAGVIADESSQVGTQLLPEAPQWLPQAAPDLSAIATHTYDFPSDATLRAAATMAASYHRPLWATEICCDADYHGYGAQYDPTMTNAMWMADTIARDLTQAHAGAFDWWVGLSAALGCDPATQAGCATTINNTGYNDGLIYYDPNFATDQDYQLYTTKRLWTLGNFSRYVRPGAVAHDVTGAPPSLRVLAFQQGSAWRLVVINDEPAGDAPTTFHVRLASGATPAPTAAYRTDATQNLTSVQPGRLDPSGALVASVPPQSVTTYLLGS